MPDEFQAEPLRDLQLPFVEPAESAGSNPFRKSRIGLMGEALLSLVSALVLFGLAGVFLYICCIMALLMAAPEK
jgi:hypothetical protein